MRAEALTVVVDEGSGHLLGVVSGEKDEAFRFALAQIDVEE